ncbi:ParA family protein, partial [Actinomycetospora soli]|uniref:ParA family protein n=1 Tax=Actinomycetospora soli TaxID=2893887 RepID=UPI001E2E913C
MRITVGCHKGGVGKTTTAVMLALQLARTGPTLLIDGDRQGSATTWRNLAGDQWPATLPVRPWRDPLPELIAHETRDLHPGLSHVVIDTGPGDPVRLTAALEQSDVALIPVGSRRGDVVQLRETVQTVEKAAAGHALSWGVLLTMVRLSTRAARQAPDAITRDDFPLLSTVVPQSAAIADAFGTVPSRFYAYADVLREITDEETTDG